MIKKIYDRKCLNCKTKFKPTSSTNTVCSQLCAIEYAKAKAIKQKAKDNALEKQKLKNSLKTLTQYEKEAKKSFQKYIRLRDENMPCISCGETGKDIWDGGHFKKAEIYSGIIFDENNCFKQCRKCNRYLNGNELSYREGLVERFGEIFVKDIEKKANETRNYKWTKEQLIAKKIQYDLKIKEFK